MMSLNRCTLRALGVPTFFFGAAALFLCWAGGAPERGVPPALAAEPAGSIVIVLDDGVEIRGCEILSENDTQVVVKTSFAAKITLPRSKIKEIRREAKPFRVDWEEMFQRASEKSDIPALMKAGAYAADKGMPDEARISYERVLSIEKDHAEARTALGYARLDGEWLAAQRVAELMKQGYVVEGTELVLRKGTAPLPGGEEKRELTPEERKRKEKEDAKARKKAERYRAGKKREYEGVDWDKRFKIDTDHYRIECNSTKDVADVYQWIMERLYKVFSTRITDVDARGGRSGVLIYRTQKEFMEREHMPPGVGAFYRPDNQLIVAYHGTFGATGSTYATLAHEATHQFQGRKLGFTAMGNMPNWLIEGMAVYFGDGSRLDPEKKSIVTGIVPRDRLLHLQQKMEDGTHERLKNLAGLPQINGSQYSDAWAVMYYMFNGPKREKGIPFIIDLWQLGKTRKTTVSDFVGLADKHFGGVPALEQDLFAFIKTLKPEPTGKLVNDVWDSFEFKFSLQLPSPNWRFQEDIREMGQLAALVPVEEKPKATAPSIAVVLHGKPDLEEADDVFLARLTDATWAKRHKLLEQKSVEHIEHVVFEVTYLDQDRPPPEPAGSGAPPPAPPPGTGPEAGPKPIDAAARRKYRSYYFMLPDKAFELKASTIQEEFPAYEADFSQALEKFTVKLENRW